MNSVDVAPHADGKKRLLIVDDDGGQCELLQRSFVRRGYAVTSANSVPQALCVAATWRPHYVVLDLRMPGPSGLTLISRLRIVGRGMRIVVTTGYASIATAVEAIKLGATHYLTKPVDANAIEGAFHRDAGDATVPHGHECLSVGRVAWEHIQGVLAAHGGNVTAAARALGMHRRTLQRKLFKFPAKR
jgi:two-component system response regulator RegA